ncbi:hypothetical protein [Niabella aquatica]
MKRFFLKTMFSSVVLFTTLFAKAQSLDEVLTDKEAPILYYGIDFTKAKLIGDPDAKPDDIVSRQFAGINQVIVNEGDKYNIAKAFRKSHIKSNLDIVNERNMKTDPGQLLSSNTEDYNRLSEKDISALIKNFNTGGRTETGLLFVVDGMNKTGKLLSVWVTLFNSKTKEILLCKRVEGNVGMAFSFRNYWAGGFKNVIDQIEKARYKEWKSK